MKYIAALSSFLFACSLSIPTQTPHNWESADLESKTVALLSDENKAYCSGVWVRSQYFITANHCVDDVEVDGEVKYAIRSDITAMDSDHVDTVRTGRLFSRDAEHDLAVVKTANVPEHRVARLAVSPPRVGQSVQTMGHPLGLLWSYSGGSVAAIRKIDKKWFVQSTAAIAPGNSGGGLFDSSGNLLGICHASAPRAQNLNIYVHWEYIRDFLTAE